MKILMLSWEYPPKNVGGLSNHVYNLSKALKNFGNDVHVITSTDGNVPFEEEVNGVFVHRVLPYSIDTEDFTKWVMHLNFAMVEAAVRIINTQGKFEIIHAHDWLTLYSAKTLKNSFNIPVVCTIHATEHGRNGGIFTNTQKYISSAEWNLTYEAWKIIVCSSYMKNEVSKIFTTPLDKIRVIPNGVSIKSIDGQNDDLQSTVRRNGMKTAVENYGWDKIALDTMEVYQEIQNEAKGTEWEVVQEKPKKKTQPRKPKKKQDLGEVF